MSYILLLLIARLNAHTHSRLLSRGGCPPTQCVDPFGNCQGRFYCFVNPCTIKNGNCGNRRCTANYCGGCYALCQGNAGDSCGTAPDQCAAMNSKCLCGLCDDDVTNYGCCGDCTLEYNRHKLLTCSGMIPQGRVCCGGFTHCVSYSDGCNTCSCRPNGLTACTKRYCIALVYEAPKCLQCEYPYIVNDGGNCQVKVTCTGNTDCELPTFKCRSDPICGGGGAASDPYCTITPDVCVDIEGGKCVSDDECSDGYRCDGYSNNGDKQCIKYQ